jgi:hypothetical protein
VTDSWRACRPAGSHREMLDLGGVVSGPGKLGGVARRGTGDSVIGGERDGIFAFFLQLD